MDLVISHNSAVRFWRTVYSDTRSPGVAPPVVRLVQPAIADDEVWQAAPVWVTPQFLSPEHGVLHTLVFDVKQRRHNATNRQHLQSHPLPPGALFDFHDGTFVVSPAFAFLQMAQSLNLMQLVAYGCELCGFYSFDERMERGIRKRKKPLVTLDQLVSFVESASGARGYRKARRALEFVVERSASPMETAATLLFTLPCRYGGYSLPRPRLNCRIDLDDAARRLYDAEFCRADLLFGENTVVEYQGQFDHGAERRMQLDRRRTNALEELGYRVIELTSSQTYDLLAFETIAIRIARATEKRIAPAQRGATDARIDLRNTLFAWNHANGCQVKRPRV